jgi:outer membrane protein TolC
MLLDRDINSSLGIPEEVGVKAADVPLGELFEIAKENESSLRASHWTNEKAKKMKSVAKQSYLPDFALKFTREEMSGGIINQKYMVGFSVPLYFWGKQNAKLKEAEANIKLAEAQYKAVKNKVLLEVKEAKINVDNYNRTKSLYENTIIPQAKASLNSTLSAYAARKIEFLSLLDSERTLISFELEYYKSIRDLYKAIADLEKAVGINFINKKEE